jgi:hypothetical protein
MLPTDSAFDEAGQVSVDSRLVLLQGNGGPTLTHALRY